ncbi:MAG: hypothetical protein COA36_09810 [Desulfotalea sp.]|nr:MAG: hypothetical protein COA36_09810 [Desulfotalea sp.]
MKNTFFASRSGFKIIISVGFTTLLLAGSNVSGSTAGPTEAEVLAALATNSIDLHLSDVAKTAKQLQQASQTLCEQKDSQSLGAARDAWINAYISWRGASPYLIGPADDLKLDYKLGGWQSNDIIMEAVTSSSEYNYLRDNIEMRGYAAAEYILFVPKDPAATTTEERCSHLLSVTDEIANLTGSAKEKWDNEFREEFITAGNGLPFMVPGDALSLVVAETLNSTEILLRDRIGLPSNFFDADARPELLEAWHSKSTLKALEAAFNGISESLAGDGKASILNLIATQDGLTYKKDPALAKSIQKQLNTIKDIIAKLNKQQLNLYSELKNDPATLKQLYQQLQKLQEKIALAVLALELDIRTGLEAELTR